MGYTKLFNEILLSTVWQEPDHVRLVWIALLAMKDERHEVMSSVLGLSKMANVSFEDTQKAIKILLSPDKGSRSKEHDGCRIKEIDGGWYILNGEKYRKKLSVEHRREYQKEWKREKRSRDKQLLSTPVHNVYTTEQNITEQNITEHSLSESDFPKSFLDFWDFYPKKVGKMAAFRAWKKIKNHSPILSALEIQVQSEKWQDQNGRFIPNPATWLNEGRWMDGIESKKPSRPALFLNDNGELEEKQ